MSITRQIARHLRDVHFGGNWTVSGMKEHLTGVTWQQAVTPVDTGNTIVAMAYHINYFVRAALEVLKGGPLNAKDAESFDHPPIHTPEDWDEFLAGIWSDAEELALLIEQLPDSRLEETFANDKYGTWYRNLNGIIEHAHYHLGQIVLIKKKIESQLI